MNTESFWKWSNTLYAKPQVSQICLQMQDEFGLNVNAVLWVCWITARRERPAAGALDSLHEICNGRAALHASGVRKARYGLREDAAQTALASAQSLKTALLALELSLEKTAQDAMQTLHRQKDFSGEAMDLRIQINLDLFLASLAMESAACARLTEQLARAIFVNTDLEPAATQTRF